MPTPRRPWLLVTLAFACATGSKQSGSSAETGPSRPEAAAAAAPDRGQADAGAIAERIAPAREAEKAPKSKPPEDLPRGVSAVLWQLSVPAGKEPTPARVHLGEKLFRDARLSADDSVSCSTCHVPEKGFVDHKATSDGSKPQRGQRNAPTVLNALFNATQFWDGRARTLEDQARLALLNPIEMGQKTPEDLVRKLRGIPEYSTAFRTLYGRDVAYEDLADAIAAFERTQYSGNSPFDRFIAGDTDAMSASARRGWSLFNGKGRCTECHAFNTISPLFSDQKFHNIGIAAHKQDFVQLAREGVKGVRPGDQKQIDELALETKFSELGRYLVTKQENDIGAFKTSNLRNVGVTAPYMHDGSLDTLWDVMDHYNKGGVQNPFLDGGIQRLGLTEREIDDLVELMFALTGEKFTSYNREEMARQRARKNVRPQRDVAAAMGKKGDFGDLAPDPDLSVKDPATLGIP